MQIINGLVAIGARNARAEDSSRDKFGFENILWVRSKGFPDECQQPSLVPSQERAMHPKLFQLRTKVFLDKGPGASHFLETKYVKISKKFLNQSDFPP